MITLDWDDDIGEGVIDIDLEFKEQHWVLKLDALSDWIATLKAEYDNVLTTHD
jgi:hypothetical protein